MVQLNLNQLVILITLENNYFFDLLTRPSEILVCERDSVNELLRVIDDDGDALALSYYKHLGILFSFDPLVTELGETISNVKFKSPPLTHLDINRGGMRDGENNWAIYPETISVTDGFDTDSFNTNVITD